MFADLFKSPRAKDTAVRASRMLAASIEERTTYTLGEVSSNSRRAR